MWGGGGKGGVAGTGWKREKLKRLKSYKRIRGKTKFENVTVERKEKKK
jgi:hypothetical protein